LTEAIEGTFRRAAKSRDPALEALRGLASPQVPLLHVFSALSHPLADRFRLGFVGLPFDAAPSPSWRRIPTCGMALASRSAARLSLAPTA